jgi:hypothetical protein
MHNEILARSDPSNTIMQATSDSQHTDVGAAVLNEVEITTSSNGWSGSQRQCIAQNMIMQRQPAVWG